ncbi:MAG: hypothetical protein E7553_02155 [Ruminococcaceae bacterium]|nr:hypothetical protein [Oscillospiraceae bacterium]
MKRFLAAALCVLMLVALTACSSPNKPTVPPVGETPSIPLAEDATGSPFIGAWTVDAKQSILEKLIFSENGTLQAFFETHQLAGAFFEDGNNVKIYISQQVLEGTFTVDGDVITIVTADDVLVLKKV